MLLLDLRDSLFGRWWLRISRGFCQVDWLTCVDIEQSPSQGFEADLIVFFVLVPLASCASWCGGSWRGVNLKLRLQVFHGLLRLCEETLGILRLNRMRGFSMVSNVISLHWVLRPDPVTGIGDAKPKSGR